MRKLLFLFLISIPVFFNSCNKIKEAVTEDFYTTLKVDIPVEVADTATTAKSTNAGYAFTASHTESLEDNDKVKDYLDLLKSIEVTDVDIEFSGIVGDQVIGAIKLSIENIGVIATLENVNTSNLTFHPEINSSVLIQIANELYFSKKITMTATGISNAAPMNFNVATSLDLHIEASPL